MTVPRSLQALFEPRSVAVVGASPDPDRPGGRCVALLQRFGFRGAIYPINPRYGTIRELPCYPDFASLPGPADLAVVLVPAASVPGYLRAAAAAGTRAAVVCSSGFAEAGADGLRLNDELVQAARESGMAVLGPNCLGVVDLQHGLAATFSTAFDSDLPMRAGPVAFLSQSGAMGAAVFVRAQAEGIGFGCFVSTGNETVLDFNDFLEHLAEDPGLSLILGYLEGLRDGRRFVAAARRARAAGKTVAVLKVGRSDAGGRAARSHTGALVGSAQAWEAAFRRAGVLPVDSVRSLIDLAVALPGRLPARGPRVGIVSASGGAGVLMTDRCMANGLVVAPLGEATRAALARHMPPFAGMMNPVDYGPVYGDPDVVKALVEIVGADPEIDLVLFFLGLSPGMAGVLEHRLAAAQQAIGKPVVAAWLGGPEAGVARLRELGVAAFDDPGRAVEVAAQLVRAGAALPEITPRAADASRAEATRATLRAALAEGRTALTEREVKALIARYRIPVVPETLATTAEEAAAAAARFGAPVAIKAEAPALLHKSDAGAVRLNVMAEDAAEAWRAVTEAAARVVGTEGVRGAVVQPMARPGLEVLAGLRHDPQFGPTLTVGLGGVLSEVLADVTTELAPIDHSLAHAMLDRLRGARLLGAFRGAAPRDHDALADLLVALGDLACDAGPLLAELDLNPVLVHPAGEGCTVVDGAAILHSDREG